MSSYNDSPRALTPLSMSSNGGGSRSEVYNATKSQLANDTAVKAHSSLPMDSSTIVYQDSYPLSNISASTDDILAKEQKNYYSYVVSSQFERSGISKTHLVPQDAKEK
jgi:hypothetical protein